jgi:4-carboxymuconolactone decarboxylase
MRLPPLQELSAEQQELRSQLLKLRGGVRGPFEVLLHSARPGMLIEELSTYCARESALPPRLRELALLVVARHFDAEHSWAAHIGAAEAAGVDPAALSRLARGEEPKFPAADEAVLYAFSDQALRLHFVDDATYAAALDAFGEPGLVDLAISLGNFATLALLLNTFQVDLPPGHRPAFPQRREEG